MLTTYALAPFGYHSLCSYGLDLFLLSIDEGIRGYRDDSLETVKRNEETYKIPLRVLSYEELYGWSMDQIVAQIGTKNNCTFCGVFRCARLIW
jgi:cytoplasmic tRNA 2-thiolation protein 1